MLSKNDLQAISELMESKLEPLNKRFDKIEERLERIEEDTEITREATNSIIEWIDFYFKEEKPFPIENETA